MLASHNNSHQEQRQETINCNNNNHDHHHHLHRDQKKCQKRVEVNPFRIFVSELLGTSLFVYLGQLSLTSFELIGTQSDIINRQLATILTSGLSFLVATFITLNLSGAHLNPGYTIASAIYKHMKWSLAFTYILGQYLGALIGAILLHATYSDKLAQRHHEGLLVGLNSTLKAHGNIFSTGKFFTSFPPTEVSLTQLFVGYILANTIFSMILISIHRSTLIKIPRYMKPIYLSLTLVLIQAAFSANGGPVLNPAQDFSPRIYISLFGWGLSAFNLHHYDYWWLCGLVAPHLGAIVGFGLSKILNNINNFQDTSSSHQYQLHRTETPAIYDHLDQSSTGLQ